jgi:hypothetical protein
MFDTPEVRGQGKRQWRRYANSISVAACALMGVQTAAPGNIEFQRYDIDLRGTLAALLMRGVIPVTISSHQQ